MGTTDQRSIRNRSRLQRLQRKRSTVRNNIHSKQNCRRICYRVSQRNHIKTQQSNSVNNKTRTRVHHQKYMENSQKSYKGMSRLSEKQVLKIQAI